MSKFVVAVKLKDAYVPLCDPCYMTNPEALASYQAAYPQRSSIKGILVDPLRVDELDELHVNHAAYNIPVGNILGETTNGLFPLRFIIHTTAEPMRLTVSGLRNMILFFPD